MPMVMAVKWHRAPRRIGHRFSRPTSQSSRSSSNAASAPEKLRHADRPDRPSALRWDGLTLVICGGVAGTAVWRRGPCRGACLRLRRGTAVQSNRLPATGRCCAVAPIGLRVGQRLTTVKFDGDVRCVAKRVHDHVPPGPPKRQTAAACTGRDWLLHGSGQSKTRGSVPQRTGSTGTEEVAEKLQPESRRYIIYLLMLTLLSRSSYDRTIPIMIC